ncbi:hypothetical protein [Shewanella surugensis]|uniref:Uncharacterized protein n=1 Tax=Shewanella surugensis TaxID=212020 RepID=A0ABT0L9X6_9GAMM|nr:hypothetical protein [Shewanella surugensis]MCL1124484.1 hypothetical protein [Shewanella surugensis]
MFGSMNSISDYCTDVCASRNHQEEMLNEAIDTKAEWIEAAIATGKTIQGHSMETVVEQLLESDEINQLIVSLYQTGESLMLIMAINKQLADISNNLAPSLINQEQPI